MKWFSPETLSEKITSNDLPEIIRDLLLRTMELSNYKNFNLPISSLSGTFGPDGVIETPNDLINPYIPSGKCIIEMGVDGYAKGKAESDYNKRLTIASRDTTYLIITPKVFNGGNEWCTEKKEKIDFP